ncbi:MAG: GNAT family N-acetyltransferase, partial [Thermoplasmata archaeon]
PEIWHISGVYTAPADRGRGHGADVVGRLLSDAAAQGAGTGLFVREDNPPARRLYDRLGFSPGELRIWVDAGADRPP